MIAVILAGGEGRRLHPISTLDKPKQFLKLSNTKYSLFQETVMRTAKLEISKTIIATNIVYKAIAKQQLKEINFNNYVLLLETDKLNTFIPIFSALKYVHDRYDCEEDVIIFPSDHFFEKFDYFINNFNNKIPNINSDKLVLFGTKTEHISSNYGYIIKHGKNDFEFLEKPSIATIKDKQQKSLEIYLNSGIFLINKHVSNKIIKNFDQDINIKFEKIDDNSSSFKNKNIKMTYHNSFDIIVLEKIKQIDVIDITNSIWMDLGNKDSLELFIKNYY